MADRSAIEWTDATWNPVTGCTKISAGCDHCYAERIQRTGQQELFGPDDDQTTPRSFESERQNQLNAAYLTVRRLLASHKSLKYEKLLGLLLEMPMVWESDLKEWLRKMRAVGEIEIPELTGRAHTSQRGHTINWKGGRNDQ